MGNQLIKDQVNQLFVNLLKKGYTKKEADDKIVELLSSLNYELESNLETRFDLYLKVDFEQKKELKRIGNIVIKETSMSFKKICKI